MRARLLALLASVTVPVWAQDDAPTDLETIPVRETADDAPDAPAQLDEIVVTAQKRRQSLQETPLSIEALNADALELRGIEGVNELAAQVPNLTVEVFPTHNATLRLFIRGVGPVDAQLTQDPAVGVYLDGIYVARAVGLALDIADLERIEVLRGPQGTLYGRNTTGGAVNLVTRRPTTGVFTMTHKVTLGERNTALAKSAVNVPLGDDAAVKLAVLGSRRDGFVENTGPGGDFGDREDFGMRFDGLWQIGDLRADYGYDLNRLSYFNNPYQAVETPETNKGTAELFKRYAQSQTTYSDRRLPSLATAVPLEESGSDVEGHALTLAMPVGSFELKYLGGFRRLTDREYADLGGGAGSPNYRLDSHAYDGPAADAANGGPTPLVIPTVTQDQWSHELQVAGPLLDTLDVIAGVFHFDEEAVEDRHRLNHQVSTGLDPNQANRVGVDATAPGFEQARLVNFVDFWWSIHNRALAGFVDLTWTPDWAGRRLHVNLGYRHSEDSREAVKFRTSDTYVETYANGEGTARLLSSGQRFAHVPASRDFRDDSLSYGLGYDFTPSVHGYLRSAQAYKSGGYNVRDPHIDGDSGTDTPSTSDDNPFGFGFVDGFNPEHVTSYETGLKSEWFDRRLRVNASAFYSEFRDMQINFLVPGSVSDTKVRNAGKADMRGIELETSWLAHPGLVLSLSGALLDAEVREVLDRDGNNVAHLFPFYSAPPVSYVASADWQFADLGFAQLRGYLAYNHVGERNGVVITEERRGKTSLPAYGLLNARLAAGGVRWWDGGLELAVWGRNLLDEEYAVSAIDNLPHADRAVIWGEPRLLGLDLLYRY